MSREYRCKKCGAKFIPDGFPKIRSKFGKGLVIWCAYQMVVGGQNMSRIQIGLATLFGIRFGVPTIYSFKETLSFHYKRLYEEILAGLVRRPVLYIDETTANLRLESGYVWCITDGRSVYYFYRSSREGLFLKDMLRNFEGVLVSDFYTAYDSLDCRHQRCLVHLMRDINEEMQRRPFDDELKLMATKFSNVLKAAVATIDRYGFKARHLAKHRKPAREFCQWASEREFRSAPAERLRLRIVKYRDKLFTFLEYDGVSWNNTYAEHFIKPFAWHRSTANGIFTEHSIQDYLVILSLSGTCAGRGQNFLEFLLEDNKDAFNFKSARRIGRAVSPTPELAPTIADQDEPR